MIAKSLVKLIDEAVVPAVVLIFGKMIGLFLTITIFDLPFEVKQRGVFNILPAVQFFKIGDYITAENYSNLAMFLIAAMGTILVLIRAHFFHESHIHPHFHARLVKFNLEGLVSSSYHLYHQAAIWLTFLWLTVGFLTLSTILEITYVPITIIAVVVAVNFSWVLAVDIEKEIEISNNNY